MWAKRLGAYTNLAVHFWRHVAMMPFTKRRGLSTISGEFLRDGVVAVDAGDRVNAPRANRCNGCGACDHLGADVAPSLTILRLGREAADAVAATRALQSLRPIAGAITAVCPEQVDVPALLHRIDTQALALATVSAERA